MNATPHILESALLLLVTFFIGCLIGFGLRRIFAKPDGGEPDARSADAPDVAPAAHAPESEPAPQAPRSDDLKRIKGIGPAMEKRLKAQGISRFAQIADWDAQAAAEMDEKLNARGRIEREHWVSQAKALANADR